LSRLVAEPEEVIDLDAGEAEAEALWKELPFSLKARGPQGMRVCISDAHLGLINAIARVPGRRGQRCTTHFLRTFPRERSLPSP